MYNSRKIVKFARSVKIENREDRRIILSKQRVASTKPDSTKSTVSNKEPPLSRAGTNSITKYNLHKSRNPSDLRSVNFPTDGGAGLVWKSAQGIYHTWDIAYRVKRTRENESRQLDATGAKRARPVNFRFTKAVPDAGQVSASHVADTRLDDTLARSRIIVRSASVTFPSGQNGEFKVG